MKNTNTITTPSTVKFFADTREGKSLCAEFTVIDTTENGSVRIGLDTVTEVGEIGYIYSRTHVGAILPRFAMQAFAPMHRWIMDGDGEWNIDLHPIQGMGFQTLPLCY
jgi:hypothetical protein